ncbi:hypothetical protein JCM8097_001178 [Rhodosporidiobolus ruineniae]
MASTPSQRTKVHRKRSPSPSDAPSTPASLSIKGRSSSSSSSATSTSRPQHAGPNKLLQSAVKNAAASATKPAPAPATPAAASDAPSPAPNSAARAQFEQQEDFISFDALNSPSPEPEERSGSGRGTPRDGGRGGRKGKRKMEDREEDEEGTKRLRDRERARSTPWCEDPGVEWSKCDSAVEMLNAEARAFVSYISPTPVEHDLRLYTIELIRRTIQSKYADATVECFGSVGTGLYLPGGDIDLVVLCPSMPSPPLKPSSSLLHRLASLLLTSSIAQPTSLVVIAKARVPIVKFTTRYGGFSVDLSVNQKNGVDAAVRVRGMLEDFAFREEGYVEPGSAEGSRNGSRTASPAPPPKSSSSRGKGKSRMEVDSDVEEGEEEDEKHPSVVKPDQHAVDYGVARCLVLLVKAFLAQRGMNEVFTGGLGSYSIICLVISFLQLHPRIQSSTLNPNRNLGLLFVEFLELYGKHFNYDEAGITLRGRGGYYNKHDKGWFRHQQPYLLSIEDPNDPQNDVSGGSHAIIRVRQTLAGGFDTLTATLLHRHSLLAAARSGAAALSAKALPNADDLEDSTGRRRRREEQSLLGSIIGMTSAGVEAREANVRLWEDGVLQTLLRRTDPNRGASGGAGAEGAGSKKALKRARKEEREREKRERTVAKLERRMEEKEARRERKERKRRERIEGRPGLDADGESVEVEVEPIVGERTIEEAKAAAASLEGMAPPDDATGAEFVIDTVGSRPFASSSRLPPPPSATAQQDEDEADDSRYSLGVPAIARKPTAAPPSRARLGATYTSAPSSDSGSDSDGDGDDGEDEPHATSDGDVVLGGSGGDFVRFDSVGRAESEEEEEEGEEEEGEEEEDEPSPPKRARTAGGKGGKAGGGKETAQQRADKKAKMAARIAFWGKKGPKEAY